MNPFVKSFLILSLNVIPLSMASEGTSLIFTYIIFLIINISLWFWGDDLTSNIFLADNKKEYIAFSLCAYSNAVISLYPLYFIVKKTGSLGFFSSIILILISFFLGYAAYRSQLNYKEYENRKKEMINKWGTDSYINKSCNNQENKQKITLGKILICCVSFLLISYIIYSIFSFGYRFTHGVSYFQNLSSDHRIKAEHAAKDFIQYDKSLLSWYKAHAFATTSQFYDIDSWDVHVSYDGLRGKKMIHGEEYLYVELQDMGAEVYYKKERQGFWFFFFKECPKIIEEQANKIIECLI